MRALVDTHVVLWWLAGDPRLGQQHATIIKDSANTILVSAISISEIAVKASIGKLDVPTEMADILAGEGFALLPFTPEHAEALRTLPWHHRDPFDRMLVAQSLVEDLPMLSADPRIREYSIECL